MSSKTVVLSNEQEAQQLVEQLHAQAEPWLAVGSQSRCARLGAQTDQPTTLLSTSALQQIHWIDAEDRTCEVDAGLSVAELNAALAEHGLMLGHSSLSGTIGGLINSGEPSLLAGSCGLPRDQVLGATWLLPDGRKIRSGARVVKSVAGYDVTRLLLSAQGQLALGLRFILRLRPLPQQLTWYRLPLDLQRPAASWKPWCDFSVGGERFAAWDGCTAPIQSASLIEECEAWDQARQQVDAACQWIATSSPWTVQQMIAEGKDVGACLLIDHLGMQSAWSQRQTQASLPAGSAVLPHAETSPWLQAFRQALI